MNIFNKAMNDIEMGQCLKEVIDGLPNYLKLCSAVAKQEKVYYDALVQEGFTSEQALILVAQHGIYAGRTDLNQNKEKED